MPWREVSAMDARRELVMLAGYEGSNLRLLCRRFGISPTTGHKWLLQFAELGEAGLVEHSRRPHSSPRRTPAEMESAVLGVREQHPAWGGRKIRRRLLDLGQTGVPSASTVTAILRRGKNRGSASSTQPPMRCGKWTSRGILH